MMSERAVTYVFTVPDALWMTSNRQPSHWAPRSKNKAALRTMGFVMGRQHPRHSFKERVRLVVRVCQRGRQRLDPSNVEPTVKPILDGLVQAGVVVDDDWKHVDGPHFEVGAQMPNLRVGEHVVEFEFTPIRKESK